MAVQTSRDLQEVFSDVNTKTKELVATAQSLNAVSDEMMRHIAAVENVVNGLNLGIEVWVTVSEASDEEGRETDYVQLAYGREARKWGFLIITFTEDHYNGRSFNDERWRFNEAPRALRIEAVDFIPQLLDALVKKSAKVAEEISGKVEFAKALAASVSPSRQGSGK